MALGTRFFYSNTRSGLKHRMWAWMYTLSNGDFLFQVSSRLIDDEPGPPRLETVQTRLLQALYLMCTCRLGQAWYSLSNAAAMATALGLHRRRGRNRGLGSEVIVNPDYVRIQCERRTFWSLYVLDKHIALMTDRPPFTLDSIDQDLPDRVNDEDMGHTGPIRLHKGDCYIDALVEHIKLNKVIERVMREVYPLDDTPEEERLERAWKLAATIEEWRAQVRPLLGAVKVSFLQLTYRRQAMLLRFAPWHAQMLVYRPFMTATYPLGLEKRRIADAAIRICVNAARSAVSLANLLIHPHNERQMRYFDTSFFAQHVTYCAALVIFLIPHIRQSDKSYWKPTLLAGRFARTSTPRQRRMRSTTSMPKELSEHCLKTLIRFRLLVDAPSSSRSCATRRLAKFPWTKLQRKLLEDALRRHWEAHIPRETMSINTVTGAEAPPSYCPEALGQMENERLVGS
ncbi:hypothetical protein VTK26DRAFT_59 [Humicola hyalothermophila]